jgi:hypothetical protein
MLNPYNHLKMPSPTNVSAGGTALFKLPIGNRYHFLHLVTAVPLDKMKIRLKINGTVKQEISAVDLDVWNQQRGLAAAAGILTIPFNRINLKDRALEEVTAINTGKPDGNGRIITSMHLEIDVDVSYAGAIAFELYADVSAGVEGGAGVMCQFRPVSRGIAGAGPLEVSDFVFNTVQSEQINSIHFVPSAGSISKIKIESDSKTILERLKTINDRIQLNGGHKRAAQAGWFSIDGCELGYGLNTINTRGLQDFRVTMDCSAAMSVKTYIEYIGSSF